MLLCVYVFSGGQETEPLSRSGVTQYRRPQELVYTAHPELINSESTSVFTMWKFSFQLWVYISEFMLFFSEMHVINKSEFISHTFFCLFLCSELLRINQNCEIYSLRKALLWDHHFNHFVMLWKQASIFSPMSYRNINRNNSIYKNRF